MTMQQDRQSLTPWKLNWPRSPIFGAFPSTFEDMFDQIGQMNQEASTGLSVSEDAQNIFVEAALPGLNPEDIEVTLDQGVLWVKGEKKEEEEDKEKRYFRRASSSFSYRVALPSKVDDAKEPKAEYHNGIMKITFKKTTGNQGKKIQVKSR